MLRGFGPRPARLHQAIPLTGEGCLRLCRQRQPDPDPESDSESGLAHSFTVSSLAQVSKMRPVGLHFILVIDSWHADRFQFRRSQTKQSQSQSDSLFSVETVYLVSINDHDGSFL